jgi:hypothetical protein
MSTTALSHVVDRVTTGDVARLAGAVVLRPEPPAGS